MNDPRSILLHVDTSRHSLERLRVARRLAETFDAQVSVQACMASVLTRYPYAMDAAAQAVALMQDLDAEANRTAHGFFEEVAAGSTRMHWEESNPDAPWGFSRRALYADLLVLGQRDRDDPAGIDLPPDFLSTTVIDSGRPTLMVPYIGARATLGRKVLIGWKETREAARAVAAALPWLRKAAEVHAVCYDESPDEPLQRLQAWLEPHGIRVTLHPNAAESGKASRLLSFAADVDADLLVMGCYGHSRARELILGGFTRSILESMTLPVLMAH
jgi:nucleotide-binding universal stress UspA family protein